MLDAGKLSAPLVRCIRLLEVSDFFIEKRKFENRAKPER
eukprot:SAG11_NODE_11007_length_790_cov_0.625181_1_plen_39_part_00